MNHLEIRYQPITNENDGEDDISDSDVDLYIDGRSFMEMVKEFESPFAADLAGRYSINIYRYTEDFLLGRCPDFEEDKIALLACICGDSGCWPLATRIQVEGERVIWDRFEQPHRENWDYSDFGPFIFDLDEYKREIQKVPFIEKLVERSRLSYWD